MSGALALWLAAASVVQAPAAERTFEITYIAEVEVEEPSGTLTMWLPYPKRDDHQDVRLISIEAPVATKVYQETLYRNSMLYLSTPLEGIESPLRVEMSFRVTRREYEERDFEELEDPFGFVDASASRWLGPNRAIPGDDTVAAAASSIVGEEEAFVARARALFDAIVADGAPAGTGASPQDAFIAMSHSLGIPVRFHAGFVIPQVDEEEEEEEGTVEAGDGWAEFYVPGFGWVPVDVLGARRSDGSDGPDAYFGRIDANRVELSLGRDLTLNPQQAGPPVDVFLEPYAEIDGSPVRDIRRELHYRNPTEP